MADSQQHPVDLLPWYVNGTLEEVEQQQVEEHLQHCESCRGEIELLRAMRDNVKQSDESIPGEFAWQRLRRDMRQNKTDTRKSRQPGTTWWLPSIAAAALLVIVVQSVVIFNASQPGGYVPAGQALEGAVVQVKFNPDATERDIREALRAVHGEIITGPSAGGIYRIRLADGEKDGQLEAKLDQLKANKDVFDYIQRD
ncbi:MAG: zf-HC2 domain-containing protein [Gammaproteobacteria bacterium]|jgi:anti-sigma factor RsiW